MKAFFLYLILTIALLISKFILGSELNSWWLAAPFAGFCCYFFFSLLTHSKKYRESTQHSHQLSNGQTGH
jgi:hypothetical protein